MGKDSAAPRLLNTAERRITFTDTDSEPERREIPLPAG